jgi:hypothetical protein
MAADFYAKSSPLVSKDISLGRNHYPLIGVGKWEGFGVEKEEEGGVLRDGG